MAIPLQVLHVGFGELHGLGNAYQRHVPPVLLLVVLLEACAAVFSFADVELGELAGCRVAEQEVDAHI